jgi:hypothetical protein
MLVLMPVAGNLETDIILVDCDRLPILFEAFFDETNVEVQNRLSGFFCQLWIFKADMDARSESFVKVADPVRRKEQNPCVIFEYTEKYCNGISKYTMPD